MSTVPPLPSSIGQSVISALESAVGLSVEALAAVIAVWDTARQTVRTIAQGVAGAAMQSQMNTILSTYPNVPLTPALLADMSVRNIGTPDFWATEAAYSGVNAERFGYMSLDAGESYGVVDAVALWHRGNYLPQAPAISLGAEPPAPVALGADQASTYGITPDEYLKVIHYARMRDEFQPDLDKLAWRTMSTADAVELLVKGRTDEATATAYFAAAGGMPEQFPLLYAAAGDAVGVEGAVMLHHRGYITDAELDDVLHQSRINPRFYPTAKLQYLHFLAPYQIRQAVAAGTVTPAQAETWMEQSGYPADQAKAFAGEAAASTVAKPKAETEAMVLEEYRAGFITEADATTALKNLGYIDSAIPFLLNAIEAARVLSMRNAAVTRLREAFVERLVTADVVRTDLVMLGAPTQAIDSFLAAWTVEQSTHVKRLTAAQVGKLLEDGMVSVADALGMWGNLGYPPDQAQLLLKIYPPNEKAPPNATITPTLDTLPADGTATTTLTVTTTSMGSPATTSMGAVHLSAPEGVIGPVTDHDDGSYTATYHAGETAGIAEIGGTLAGVPIAIGAIITLSPVTTTPPPAG